VKLPRARLSTLLFAVAILALLLLVVIQQVRIGRMQQVIDKGMKDNAELTMIIRELRDHLERQGR
jgi:C4-dicarboxylate-specific signal transduction histidine kinase